MPAFGETKYSQFKKFKDRLFAIASADAVENSITIVMHGHTEWFKSSFRKQPGTIFSLQVYTITGYHTYLDEPVKSRKKADCLVVHLTPEKMLEPEDINNFTDANHVVLVNYGAYPPNKLAYSHPSIPTTIMEMGEHPVGSSEYVKSFEKLLFVLQKFVPVSPKFAKTALQYANMFRESNTRRNFFRDQRDSSYSALYTLHSYIAAGKNANDFNWVVAMLDPEVFIDPLSESISGPLYAILTPIQQLMILVQLPDQKTFRTRMHAQYGCDQSIHLEVTQENLLDFADFLDTGDEVQLSTWGKDVVKKINDILSKGFSTVGPLEPKLELVNPLLLKLRI